MGDKALNYVKCLEKIIDSMKAKLSQLEKEDNSIKPSSDFAKSISRTLEITMLQGKIVGLTQALAEAYKLL